MKITSSDYRDYVIRDGRFIGEFDQMYRNVADPWHCVALADGFKGDLLVTATRRFAAGATTALDLGCGLGALTARLQAAAPHARWRACDLSPKAIEDASRRVDAVDFFVHDLSGSSPLPADDASVDVVTMAEVMWYILPQLDRVLREIRRVLTPGGLLLMMQYFLRPEDQGYGRDIVAGPADLLRFVAGAGLDVEHELYLGARPPLDALVVARRPAAALATP